MLNRIRGKFFKPDFLSGGNLDDRISGYGGNDSLYGGSGDDVKET